MLPQQWKDRLLKIPGAPQVRKHLLAQGHTEAEAEAGGLIVSGLVLFLGVILFNSFLIGMVRTFFSTLWAEALENPAQGVLVGLLGTMAFLGLLFRFSRQASEKKAEKK